MSLLRLLAAGKSLVGLKDSGVRYRDLGPQALPRFEGKEKLFRSSRRQASPAPDPAAKSTVSAETSAPDIRPKMNPSATPVELQKTWRAKWLALWRRKTTSSIPRFDQAPIQTELSLDRVKVVRNDLSDSDLEVVPARTSVAVAGAPGETKGIADLQMTC